MQRSTEVRIIWAVVWLLCLSLVVAQCLTPFVRSGMTQSRELLVGIALLAASTAGLYFSWGPLPLATMVGGLMAAVVESAYGAFFHTLFLVTVGLVVGLVVDLLAKHRRHLPSKNP